ncbi:MAG TPA: hypothetical protein VK524_22320 [Polyangiaceae bacterium]|nr:hypothetical protein [Polyangiaceae bacterium]
MAHANAGVPMLVLILPGGALSLPLVILIEAAFLRRLGLDRLRSLKLSAFVNAASTLFGVPVTWFVLWVVEMLGGSLVWRLVVGKGAQPHELWQKIFVVLWSAPWLVPLRDEPTPWMLPAATLALLIPFFFVSYAIEAHLMERALPHENLARVRQVVWRANIVTYSTFAAATLAWLLFTRGAA